MPLRCAIESVPVTLGVYYLFQELILKPLRLGARPIKTQDSQCIHYSTTNVYLATVHTSTGVYVLYISDISHSAFDIIFKQLLCT